jgi:hypothetical protein
MFLNNHGFRPKTFQPTKNELHPLGSSQVLSIEVSMQPIILNKRMRPNQKSVRANLLAAFLGGIAISVSAGAEDFFDKTDTVRNVTLGQLAAEDVQLVDLTHELNDKSPFWPGADYQPFELKTIATIEKNGVFSKTFAMPDTHVVNGAGRYGLENVANLDKLPARNFFLIVAPIKITTGTGGPTRLFAVPPLNK